MKSSTKIIIIISTAFILLGLYFWLSSNISNHYVTTYNIEDFYSIPDRRRQVNEYKNATVSDEEMAKKYFNAFILIIFENPQGSYNLIEEDYKEMKYPSYKSYESYLKTITKDFSVLPSVSKYKKDVINNKSAYVVLDSNENEYKFIIDGVMKYKVEFAE